MSFRGINKQVFPPDKLIPVAAIVSLVWLFTLLFSSCDAGYSPPSFENVPATLAQAPCIANVCIGTVGRQKVLEELSQNELLYNIRDNGGTSIGFSIERGGIGGVIFRQGEFARYEVVEHIELHVVGMPLGTVLDSLGEPDELSLMFGCGRGSHVHGKLLYRDKGIEVQVQFPVKMNDRAAPIVLDDTTPMLWIWYFDPARYEEWLLNIHEDLRVRSGYFILAPGVTAEMLAAAVQPWPGLGVSIETLDVCPR